jgi:four helix bundle protein
MSEEQPLRGHRDLREEKYSLTDQIRRSSRSVAANIAEGFRKRQYPRMFVSKLADA